MRKPNVIDRIVVSTEPMTEKNPLTAHAHATYSLAVVGQRATAAEPERHEHAEAEAERRQDERARRRRAPRGRRQQGVGDGVEGELVEEREHGQHAAAGAA